MLKRSALPIFFGVSALGVVLIGLCFFYFVPGEPIRIGLVTTLSGKGATSGTHSRNGALLAVEKINRSGGVNGRPVELVVRDDGGSIEQALRVDREMIDSGVVAILGHFSSTLAVAAVPLVNEKNVLMVGLGTITDKLSNLDDNFIRVAMALDLRIPVLAEVAYAKFNVQKMAIVYDLSNPLFAESCYQTYKKSFEALGGEIVQAIAFNSKESFSLASIADEIAGTNADGLLLVTSAIHGAMLTQHVRNNGSNVKIFDSGWGISDPEFIMHGGRAIEGVASVHQFNDDSTNENFIKFKKAYKDRFGDIFGNTAQRGYEAASLILYALSQTNDPRKLKEVILKRGVFDGVDGKIRINKYGDAIRSIYLLEVQEHKVRTREKLYIDRQL